VVGETLILGCLTIPTSGNRNLPFGSGSMCWNMLQGVKDLVISVESQPIDLDPRVCVTVQ
jgi:hypothetical protein